MTIFGKNLWEYIRFQKVILGLIVVVALARLALSLAGVPNSSAKWLSVSAVSLLGLLYYAVRVHTRGFGSYRHLLPLLGIQNLTTQLLIVGAIALAIFTGQDNIYSAPEYSGGVDGKTWSHASAHLVLGTIVLTLIGWLVASGIMFVTKKVAPATTKGGEPKAKGKSAAARA
jgi:hypothetical protein